MRPRTRNPAVSRGFINIFRYLELLISLEVKKQKQKKREFHLLLAYILIRLGLPHASYFPYDTLEAKVALPQRFESKDKKDSHSGRVTVPKESPTPDVTRKIDLTTALQYGTAEGYPPLSTFLRSFTRDHLHPNVPYVGGPEVVLTCGSTDGFAKAIEAFTNIWNPDRDWIQQREGVLCEEFAYMNAIQTVSPRGLNIAGVVMDGQGMLASGKGGLQDVLENWDFRRGRRPHLMYTVS